MRIILNIFMVLIVFVLAYLMLFTGFYAIWNISGAVSGDEGMGAGILFAVIALVAGGINFVLVRTLVSKAQRHMPERDTSI
ncbi:MAG: hypothetical protein AAFV33_12645 [Chloroflexota bacterium]